MRKFKLPTHYPPADKGRVVILGLLAAMPFGGMVWQVLHHLVGFRRLGFDVWYVEDSRTTCMSPTSWQPVTEFSETVDFLADIMGAIDLEERWVFRPPGKPDDCYGALGAEGLGSLYRSADAVFNLCASHRARGPLEDASCLVQLQTDPVAAQIDAASGNEYVRAFLDRHDHLFTYGENIGHADCPIPTGGYRWHATRPPVVLDWWEAGEPTEPKRMTTVGNWRNKDKPVQLNGETYRWQKSLEFAQFEDLPAKSPFPVEMSVIGMTVEEAVALLQKGWDIRNARLLSDAESYRAYIRSSAGEFTVAKDQNVRLWSGWFSDRSACYLAAGRPVVTQDTGFGRVLPTGNGLFAFTNVDEAADAITKIASDYDFHSRAARRIAETYFDAEKVLGDIARTLGLL
ncbi:MAG TPA: hypothetical protein VMO47_02985 [Rhodothermales bacterium]|nr:hypothetical protein [Rhodothermales bacterium]